MKRFYMTQSIAAVSVSVACLLAAPVYANGWANDQAWTKNQKLPGQGVSSADLPGANLLPGNQTKGKGKPKGHNTKHHGQQQTSQTNGQADKGGKSSPTTFNPSDIPSNPWGSGDINNLANPLNLIANYTKGIDTKVATSEDIGNLEKNFAQDVQNLQTLEQHIWQQHVTMVADLLYSKDAYTYFYENYYSPQFFFHKADSTPAPVVTNKNNNNNGDDNNDGNGNTPSAATLEYLTLSDFSHKEISLVTLKSACSPNISFSSLTAFGNLKSYDEICNQHGINTQGIMGAYNLLGPLVYVASNQSSQEEQDQENDGKPLTTYEKSLYTAKQAATSANEFLSNLAGPVASVLLQHSGYDGDGSNSKGYPFLSVAMMALGNIVSSRTPLDGGQSLMGNLRKAVTTPLSSDWVEKSSTYSQSDLLRVLVQEMALNNYIQFLRLKQQQDSNTIQAASLLLQLMANQNRNY